MPHRLRVSDEIAEFLRSLHPEIKRKIKAGLDIIISEPDPGKSLKDQLGGLKSFKVGRFRIIYKVGSKRTIEIVAIGPRRIVYEETYRILKKDKPPGE